MKTFSDKLADAYVSWLNSASLCCLPCVEERPSSHRAGLEKEIVVLRDQPGFTPPPSLEPWIQSRGAGVTNGPAWERAPGKRSGSLSRRSFSVRSRFRSNASSTRRPQISAPSNFRHLYSESYQISPQPHPYTQLRQRPSSFRPLELSIYMPDNVLSPILPHFDYTHPDITPPPPAHTTTSSNFDSDGVTLAHQRSYSSMSFHLPRRQLPDSSPSTSYTESPPRIPPRSRMRAYTSPSVDQIVERIASAMIERDRLQSEIESVIDRQSIYASSRPSTAYGLEDLEPMPSIPALPAAAPSFAERLSTERPQTAPPKSPVDVSRRDTEAPAAFAPYATPPRQMTPPRLSPRINGRPVDIPLAPPLPLVLRPPLRKKKSFSRVSNWLFPGENGQLQLQQRQPNTSVGSITNVPRPVRDGDGFYQCVTSADGAAGRTSIDSVSTVSTWTTEEDRTVPTTWSPGSSPVTKQETPTPTVSAAAEKRTTFGQAANNGHRPQSVGVAF